LFQAVPTDAKNILRQFRSDLFIVVLGIFDKFRNAANHEDEQQESVQVLDLPLLFAPLDQLVKWFQQVQTHFLLAFADIGRMITLLEEDGLVEMLDPIPEDIVPDLPETHLERIGFPVAPEIYGRRRLAAIFKKRIDELDLVRKIDIQGAGGDLRLPRDVAHRDPRHPAIGGKSEHGGKDLRYLLVVTRFHHLKLNELLFIFKFYFVCCIHKVSRAYRR
jgi:hypothetical protein